MNADLAVSSLTGVAVGAVENRGQHLYLIRLGTPGGTSNYLADQLGAEELRRQLEAALFAAMIAGEPNQC
jgi:hypothetical protein